MGLYRFSRSRVPVCGLGCAEVGGLGLERRLDLLLVEVDLAMLRRIRRRWVPRRQQRGRSRRPSGVPLGQLCKGSDGVDWEAARSAPANAERRRRRSRRPRRRRRHPTNSHPLNYTAHIRSTRLDRFRHPCQPGTVVPSASILYCGSLLRAHSESQR